MESAKGRISTDDRARQQPLWTVVLGLQPHSLACRVLSIALFMVRLSYLGSLRAVLGINISLSDFELQLQQVQSLLNSHFWRTIFEPLPNQIFRVMFDVT